MKQISILALVLWVGLMLLSCEKTTKVKPDTSFSINVEVVDTLGNPVPDLEVSYFYHFTLEEALKKLERPSKTDFRIYTTIPVYIPVGDYDSLSFKIDIFDIENVHLKSIVRNTINNFENYRIDWDGTTDDGTQVYDGVYRTELTVLTPGIDTSGWNKTIYMWACTLRSMGITDVDGKFTISERKLFPGLYNTPPMDLTYEDSNVFLHGVQPGKEIYIRLRNPLTEESCRFLVEYEDAPNSYHFVWRPEQKIEVNKRLINTQPAPRLSHSFAKKNRDYGLHQNYPNPFN